MFEMTTKNTSDSSLRQRIWLMAVICSFLVPAVTAYAVMYHFSCNVPVIDDYHAILDFSLHFLTLTTFREKFIYLIAAQHNEYKLITQQAVLIAQLHLIHHINFSFFILIGNLLLLPILLILWKICFSDEGSLHRRLTLFLPIPWVFFTLNYFETVDFPISGIQVLAVILFGLLALYLLGKSLAETGWSSFLWAILAAIVGCLTYANAFLLAPAGLFVLVLRRAYLKAALWCLAFVLPLIPFLYRYHSSSHFFMKDLPLTPLFFLSFLGSGLVAIPIGIAFGLGIVVIYCIALRNRYDRENPAAFLVATWVLLCGVVVTYGRIHTGFWVSHSSRYRLYSDILLIFCYAYIAPRVARSAQSMEKKRRLYRYALVSAILFGIAGDLYGWVLLKQRRHELVTGLAQYRAEPELHSPMYFLSAFNESGMAVPEAAARVTLTKAIAAGIYDPPVLSR
jgi:hypothetical protein